MTRCAARSRTAAGFARCHLENGHPGAHHISDREWGTGPIRFGDICDCAADDLVSYYGGGPTMYGPGGHRSGWPTPWPQPLTRRRGTI